MKTITKIGASIQDREFPLIDIGIAAEHFCLQAAEEGLGTCMLGWFNEKPIKELLRYPERQAHRAADHAGLCPGGLSVKGENPKKTDEVISYNSYK